MKKYDFIFSIGAACSSTQALRSAGLQYSSYPLDWLIGGDFLSRIDILTSEFKGFIEKSDLSFVTEKINHDTYFNNKTQITFHHDFPTGIPFNVSYPIVYEKYQRRINRLLTKIKKANSILIVFIESPARDDKTPNEKLLLGLKKLKEKYPHKEIDILYFTIDINMKPQKLKTEIISPNIIRYTANYKSYKPNAEDYEVNLIFLQKILKHYKLNLPLGFIIKEQSKKILINLIPIKSIKKKLKKKFRCY